MKRKGIMLCYPFDVERLKKWGPPYIVQPKLDGERCRAIVNMTGVTLLSSEENVKVSIPHINKAVLEIAKQTNFSPNRPLELDGELYMHGMERNDIHSIVSREANIHSDYGVMQYHIFDIINDQPQFKRLSDLIALNPSDIVKIVDYRILSTVDEVVEQYDKFIELGYEGIVVRHFTAPYIRRRSTYMVKFKPKKDDWYKIVGWKEQISIEGVPKGRLGAIVCKDDMGTEFSVGSWNIDDTERDKLWEERDNIAGKLCHVKYQHLSPKNHVPLHSVFLEILEESEEYVGLTYA